MVDIIKVNFTGLITSAANILFLIVPSFWYKAIISEICILLSRP